MTSSYKYHNWRFDKPKINYCEFCNTHYNTEERNITAVTEGGELIEVSFICCPRCAEEYHMEHIDDLQRISQIQY